jgi:hypothetical protein
LYSFFLFFLPDGGCRDGRDYGVGVGDEVTTSVVIMVEVMVVVMVVSVRRP